MPHPRRKTAVLAWLLATALLPTTQRATAQETVVYLVRHAERESSAPDTPLSEAGRQRAALLERMLQDVPLRSVLSTDTRRTRESAAPVAGAHGLGVELYDPGDPTGLVFRIRSTPGQYLVVGHSNTIPELVRLLGGDPGEPIADDEYDRLYLVFLAPGGNESASVLLRYGEAGGQGPLRSRSTDARAGFEVHPPLSAEDPGEGSPTVLPLRCDGCSAPPGRELPEDARGP